MLNRSLIISAVLCVPLLAFAAAVRVGDTYFLKASEKTADDLYVIASSAAFAGSVTGDVVALAGEIFTQGILSADALFLGENIHVLGEVRDDVRAAGAEVSIGGGISDDAIAIGSQVTIEPSAAIGGDLVVVAGKSSISGSVAGSVKIFSQSSVLRGTIAGDVEAWGDLQIEDGAAILGDLIYHGKKEAFLHTEAKIGGETIYAELERKDMLFAFFPGMLTGFFSLQILMALAVGFFLLFLLRERTEEVLQEVTYHFWPRVLRGGLIAVLLPVGSILLALSVVGLPLALVLLMIFASSLMLCMVGAGILLGLWLERVLFRRAPFPLSWRPVLLGVIFLSLISVIPYIGPLVVLFLWFSVLGGAGTVVYRHIRMPR